MANGLGKRWLLAMPVALAVLAALPACSRASHASRGADNSTAPAQPAVTRSPAAALLGTWAGVSGVRCWADVIEFGATEMTYQPAGGGAAMKTVPVAYKNAGPKITQVVPEAGAPTSYTSTDADHLTDAAGCLYERTD